MADLEQRFAQLAEITGKGTAEADTDAEQLSAQVREIIDADPAEAFAAIEDVLFNPDNSQELRQEALAALVHLSTKTGYLERSSKLLFDAAQQTELDEVFCREVLTGMAEQL